jgi:hypothetical protein
MKLGVITERENGETCGAWKKPEWKLDTRWFKCRECKFVIPESHFEGANVEAKICKSCMK